MNLFNTPADSLILPSAAKVMPYLEFSGLEGNWFGLYNDVLPTDNLGISERLINIINWRESNITLYFIPSIIKNTICYLFNLVNIWGSFINTYDMQITLFSSNCQLSLLDFVLNQILNKQK